MRQQFQQNLLLKHVFHLKRHSRHRNIHRFSFLKPHARCCAITVRDICARLRNERLPTVTLGHLITAFFKDAHHIVVSVLTKFQFRTEIFAQRRLRDVVGGRSQASCHNDDFNIRACIQSLNDVTFAITYGQSGNNFYSIGCQYVTKPSGISVHHLSNQQFVTY